jgi:sec-independent protein translocase protein TatB
MFDIAFSELVIIALVALIVIGPERLPTVARTVGHLLGRMQRYVSDVKADIAREIELEELRKLQTSMEDAARSFESTVAKGMGEAQAEFERLGEEARARIEREDPPERKDSAAGAAAEPPPAPRA